jgi:hypothetical protein
MIGYESAPNNWDETWRRYVEHRIAPGSFGVALLCNDLKLAAMCADHVNINLIGQHTLWMLHNLPEECWGSYESYERWVTPAHLGRYMD